MAKFKLEGMSVLIGMGLGVVAVLVYQMVATNTSIGLPALQQQPPTF